jgi:DHA3 family macrolide efflux protein-like MFS transporter
MQTATNNLGPAMPVEKHKLMKAFWVVFSGQSFSLLGSSIVQFTLVWWLTTSTGSASVLATATAMAILPQVFISPFAGALIDRWDRRKVMIVADALTALAVVILALLFSSGLVQFWHIYALMFLRAACAAFQWPAMQASTSLMVPKEHLSRVAGLNQALMGLANIVAAPIGALLLNILPMQSILFVDVATAAMAIAPLLLIRIPRPQADVTMSPSGLTTVISDLVDGLRFVMNWRGLLLVMGMAMVFNLLMVPAMALTPLLVMKHFAGGSSEYALLQAAMGVGMIAGGLLLGAWGGFKNRIQTGLIGAILMGVGTSVVGLAPSNLYNMALIGIAFAGIMNPIVNGSLFSVLQSTVPPEKQGRVFTLLISGSAAMSPIGLAFAGLLAESLSVQTWFLAGGLIIIFTGISAFFVPDIMRMESHVRASTGNVQ